MLLVRLGASGGLLGGPGICLFGLVVRRAGEFIQERQAKAYEASLRKKLDGRHPNLTERQRTESPMPGSKTRRRDANPIDALCERDGLIRKIAECR